MNTLTITAYCIYIVTTFIITVYVGWLCYKNGIYFIQEELQDHQIAAVVNNLLLLGYYLINLGYSAIMIYNWQQVQTLAELIETVSHKTGYILCTLAIMHYMNILVIYLAHKRSINHSKNKPS